MGTRRVNDLVGKRFCNLFVVSLNEEESNKKRGKRGDKIRCYNCICDCGKEIIVMTGNLTTGKAKSCGCLNKGENSPMWKGGITPISQYLRGLQVVSQWRKDTYKRENNKCQLTGKQVHGGNSDVHHLYGFNMIVQDAHDIYNIKIKPQVKDYTKEELKILEDYVTEWHKDTTNAVLLSEEIHNLFHTCRDKDGNVLYGSGNNTPEQYEEFKQHYLNGEFDDLLGDDLDD